METIEAEVRDCYAKAGHQPPNTSCVCGWKPEKEPPWPPFNAPPLMDDEVDAEVRSVSSTGAEKGTKLARFDLIPTGALTELAKHYGRGARKYADHNWRAGYEWGKSYAALQRHAHLFWGGEDIDPETGTPHIICVAWHALALYTYMNEHPEFDDRYIPEQEVRKARYKKEEK